VRSFWPPAEPAQADYEALRAAVLAGTPRADADAAAARFSRSGLAALIAAPQPQAEPVFSAVVTGAPRLPWTAHADPRAATLAAGFGLLLQAADGQPDADQQDAERQEVAR
jgi:hypothetical protein